ncbi:MAG TPA: LPS assembly lipoprotein LptE [Ignavibacteria bacterium]|nr:LPS assembly lipoprotein LptE [Ignavibacteria bacterium]
MRYVSKINLLIPVLLLFLFSGCGVYGFRGNNPPEGIKSINIPLFEDVSGFSQPGVKERFTETLKNLVISDNTFQLTDRTLADGLVSGTIKTITDDPLVISGNETVTKRKITITVDVNFQNIKKQRSIWNKTFSNFGEYNSDNTGFSNRDAGVIEATNKICQDILNDLTSNW